MLLNILILLFPYIRLLYIYILIYTFLFYILYIYILILYTLYILLLFIYFIYLLKYFLFLLAVCEIVCTYSIGTPLLSSLLLLLSNLLYECYLHLNTKLLFVFINIYILSLVLCIVHCFFCLRNYTLCNNLL